MRYACVFTLLLAVGCGDDGGGDGSDSGRGRGSAACQDWQDAICDFAVGQCAVIDRATCDENYQAVTCNSDQRASDCANAFNQATCMAPPPSCDLTDLADPAPARQACEQLVSRLCDYAVECGMNATEQECLQEAAMQFDCSQALGFTPSYDDCLAMIDGLQCTAVALPDVCDDVIKILR